MSNYKFSFCVSIHFLHKLWEKLLKYQKNWTWVIMFSILMISLTDKPLILQWEVWLTSLLGLKGLRNSPRLCYTVMCGNKKGEFTVWCFSPQEWPVKGEVQLRSLYWPWRSTSRHQWHGMSPYWCSPVVCQQRLSPYSGCACSWSGTP